MSIAISCASSAQLPSFPFSQGTYLPPASGSGGFGANGNSRAQAADERSAAILKLDQEIGEQGNKIISIKPILLVF